MKKAITIGLAALALGVPLTYVIAASRYAEPVTPADVRQGDELFDRLRLLQLEPQGQPIRRGPYYVVHAIDARGRTLRVVADAQLGDILSIAPVHAPGWQAQGGPRIIHIPDPNDVRDARVEQDWQVDAPADVDEFEDVRPRSPRPLRPVQRKADIPPPKQEPAPRRPYNSAPAPKPAEPAATVRRNLISAPPAQVRAPIESEGLSPVYPTPRFTPQSDKLAPPPAEAASAAPAADTSATEPAGAAAPAQQ